MVNREACMYMGMLRYMYWIESGYRNPHWVCAGGSMNCRACSKNENPGGDLERAETPQASMHATSQSTKLTVTASRGEYEGFGEDAKYSSEWIGGRGWRVGIDAGWTDSRLHQKHLESIQRPHWLRSMLRSRWSYEFLHASAHPVAAIHPTMTGGKERLASLRSTLHYCPSSLPRLPKKAILALDGVVRLWLTWRTPIPLLLFLAIIGL